MNRIVHGLLHLFNSVYSVSIMAAVLIVLIISMQRLLGQRLKPRWHYLLWLLVMIRLLLPWSPESSFSVYHWIGYGQAAAPDSPLAQTGRGVLTHSAGAADTAVRLTDAPLLWLWLAGTCILSVYTVWVNWTFAREIRRGSTMVADERLLFLFNQCKTAMSVTGTVSLVESRSLRTPALFGFFRPRLVLPWGMAEHLSDNELQHVFLHELAHLKRKDIWFNGIMHALLIIHWFNPFLWYAYRRMREDQEIASDALALSFLAPNESLSYGHTLIKLLEHFSKPSRRIGHVSLGGTKTQLRRRITMIKHYQPNSYRWSFLGLAAIIMISGCTLTSPKADEAARQTASSAVTQQSGGSEISAQIDQTAVTNTPPESDKPDSGNSIVTDVKDASSAPIATEPKLVEVSESQPRPVPVEALTAPASQPSDASDTSGTRARQTDAPRATPAPVPSVSLLADEAASQARQTNVQRSTPAPAVSEAQPTEAPSLQERQAAAQRTTPAPVAPEDQPSEALSLQERQTNAGGDSGGTR